MSTVNSLKEVLDMIPDPTVKDALEKYFGLLAETFNSHTHVCGGDEVISSTPTRRAGGKSVTTGDETSLPT